MGFHTESTLNEAPLTELRPIHAPGTVYTELPHPISATLTPHWHSLHAACVWPAVCMSGTLGLHSIVPCSHGCLFPQSFRTLGPSNVLTLPATSAHHLRRRVGTHHARPAPSSVNAPDSPTVSPCYTVCTHFQADRAKSLCRFSHTQAHALQRKAFRTVGT